MRTLSRPIRSVAALAFLIGALTIADSHRPLVAGESPMGERTVTVTGEGEVLAQPDQARLSAGVLTQAQSAQAAMDANTAAMNRVFAALRMLGIPENRIQTSNFSVQPQYPPFRPDMPEPRTIIGYQVSNQVSVTLNDISRLGAALDALVRSGANRLGGIAFTIADPKPLAERARAVAVADAMAKARMLAQAAGVTLGPLLSIQESTAFPPPIPFLARAELAAAPDVPPVAAGEAAVRVQVMMVYAIR